jgi:hypothetical protein
VPCRAIRDLRATMLNAGRDFRITGVYGEGVKDILS